MTTGGKFGGPQSSHGSTGGDYNIDTPAIQSSTSVEAQMTHLYYASEAMVESP